LPLFVHNHCAFYTYGNDFSSIDGDLIRHFQKPSLKWIPISILRFSYVQDRAPSLKAPILLFFFLFKY
jgi:hypothetical protein